MNPIHQSGSVFFELFDIHNDFVCVLIICIVTVDFRDESPLEQLARIVSNLLVHYRFQLFARHIRAICIDVKNLILQHPRLCRLCFHLVCRAGICAAIDFVYECRAVRIRAAILFRSGKQKSDCHRVTISFDIHVDILAGCAKTVVDSESFLNFSAWTVYIELEVRLRRIVLEETLHELQREDSFVAIPPVHPRTRLIRNWIV